MKSAVDEVTDVILKEIWLAVGALESRLDQLEARIRDLEQEAN